MKTTIRLEGTKHGAVDLEVDTNKVANASMLIYKGQHFYFKGMAGRIFTLPSFEKCAAPVDITDCSEEA